MRSATHVLALSLALSLGAGAGGQNADAPATAEQGLPANAVLIDVRSQQEWDAGHIERATLIPHTEIAARIASVAPDKNTPVVLYCRSGNRAGKAKAELEAMGYSNVQNWGSLEQARAKLGQ